MPITYVVEEKLRLVRTESIGTITVQDILDHLAAQKEGGTVTYRELVDARGATEPYLSPSELWQAAQAVLAVALKNPAGPRAVVVAHHTLQALCRGFATLVEDAFPIRVFRDPALAEHWLLEEHREKAVV